MAKVQGNVGSVQGIYNNAGDFLGLSLPSGTGDGVDVTLAQLSTSDNGNISGLIVRDQTIPFVLGKIRSSIASAQNNNPQIKAPYAPAPVWAATTLYPFGAIVRGLTAGSTTNLYYMAGNNVAPNTSGTSDVAIGPTGTANALITDGTCRWIYFGQISATTATPLLSTATLTTSADSMNGYLQHISSATATAIGLVTYRPSSITGSYATEVHITGGIFGYKTAEQLSQPNTGTVGTPLYVNPPKNTIAFSTNARKWLALKSNANLTLTSSYTVEVNGVILGESPLFNTVITNNCLLINLESFPDTVKNIRVHWNGNTLAKLAFEIQLAADETVWATENANRWKLACEGDSITDGSYIASAGSTNLIFERLLADRLGCDHYYNNAVGGTGLISDGVGAKTTYLQRLPDIVAFAPDVLVIGGFHNDVGNAGAYTSTLRRAAILAYLQAVRTALPNCYIFVIGAQLLQGDTMTTGGALSMYDVEVDAREAVIAFDDAKTNFIPLLTDVKNRLTNANGRFYLVTTAPYNTDAHPTPKYYPFITGYLAEKVKKFFSGLTY